MSALALALTLSVTSGGLLAEQSPTAVSARLITGAAAANVETRSRSELEMERANLIDHRPGLGGGIALLAGGGGATLFFGLPFLLFGLVEGYLDAFVVGLIITVVGVGAVVAGIVLLVVAGSARAASAARVKEIDARIQRMEQQNEAPPPPPPPPPGAWLMQVEPSLLVARF